jgi:hypothetical protein
VARIVAERDAAPQRGPDPEDADLTALALTRSGLFSVRAVRRFRWGILLDDQQVLRLFTTFSDWSPEEAERAAEAVRDLGGSVVEHYRTWLIALVPEPESSGDVSG